MIIMLIIMLIILITKATGEQPQCGRWATLTSSSSQRLTCGMCSKTTPPPGIDDDDGWMDGWMMTLTMMMLVVGWWWCRRLQRWRWRHEAVFNDNKISWGYTLNMELIMKMKIIKLKLRSDWCHHRVRLEAVAAKKIERYKKVPLEKGEHSSLSLSPSPTPLPSQTPTP